MSINEKPLQLNPIIRRFIGEIFENNENINITVLLDNPYQIIKQHKDISTSEISIHPINQAELIYTVKIGDGTIFLCDKYNYDKDTNTLSLYKKA